MRAHIDWITFTMTPVYKSHYPEGMSIAEVYADGILGAWETTFSASVLARCFGGSWSKRERSRAPYTDSWELTDAGISLYASQTLTHCTVEISGKGCERLIDLGAINQILLAIHDRVTRIDIACDIETKTSPLEFVQNVTHERMRASGHYVSETGETCYVGSQKSERFARVYRYFDPHPRAHLLRVEHVFRKDYAKSVALACAKEDILDVAAAAGGVFGWKHPDWQVSPDRGIDLSIVGSERKSSNTIRWLITACAPAFKTLVSKGEIKDADEFINRYFLSDT